jgi:hypothetical protein
MACGYHGHVCSVGTVQFISRYRDANDYCVDGRRITVRDDGHAPTFGHEAVALELVERIWLWELERYAAYLRWHCEAIYLKGIQIQPFHFSALSGRTDRS